MCTSMRMSNRCGNDKVKEIQPDNGVEAAVNGTHKMVYDVTAQEAKRQYEWHLQHCERLSDINCVYTRVIQTAEDKHKGSRCEDTCARTPPKS